MSTDPSDTDRWREAFRSREPGTAAPPGCPDADRLWSVLEGKVRAEERTRIIEHTGRCPSCAEAWRLAHRMGALDERGDRPVPRGWQRWGGYAAAAAAVLLVAGVVYRVGPLRQESEPVYRSGEAKTIRALVPESTPQPRSSLHLRWSSQGEGALYTLRVTNERFEPLFTLDGIEETECLVPESALTGTPAGGRLLWQVEAYPPDGTRVVSDTFFVTLD